MNLDLFVENLREKYNYGANLTIFIKKLILSLIDYYGEEQQNVILNAFYSTPIVVGDITDVVEEKNDTSSNDWLSEITYDPNDPTSIFGKKPNSDERNLKYANGGLIYWVEQEGNIPVVKRKLAVNFDIDAILGDKDNIDISKVGAFVHEICHMIKTNIKKNVDGSYDLYSGINHYRVEVHDNGECELLDYNQGEGLDEALNYIDEVMIMRKYFDSQYESKTNYKRLASIIYDHISDNDMFMKSVKHSLIEGTSDWKESLGEELSEELLSLCNEHNELMLTPVILRAIGNNTLDDLKNKTSLIEERLCNILSKLNDVKKV